MSTSKSVSHTPSLIPTHPFTILSHPSKIISTAINNPLTFILFHLWNPPALLAIFTSPIPVSPPPLPRRRFLIAGAVSLLLLGLIAAGTLALGLIVLSPLILVSSPVWVPAAVAVLVAGGGLLSVWASVVAVAWVVQRFFSAHKVKLPCSDLKVIDGKGAAPGA